MNRRLGWRPDPVDHRDHDHAFDKVVAPALRGAVPLTAPRLPFHAPLDQGNLGSCVAHAVVQALFAAHARHLEQSGQPLLASRLAIYYFARAVAKMQSFDSGTYIRTAIMVLNLFGFAPETDWPYDEARFAEMPPTSVFQGGIDQRVGASYHRIFENGDARCDAVRLAISNGHAVIFGLDVDDTFLAYDFDAVWDGPTSPIVGGHAMVLGSYDEDGPELLNSWGSWSEDGWARMSWHALKTYARDLWVVDSVPYYSSHADSVYDEVAP